MIISDLNAATIEFEKLFDLYIHTDWERIKAETIGKRKTGGWNKWREDYDRALGNYNENMNKI